MKQYPMQMCLSQVARSNLLTKGITFRHGRIEQAVPEKLYTIPNAEIRKLLARLILEEALETINALGFELVDQNYDGIRPQIPECQTLEPDLEKIIDGACDTIYVATGAMMAMGVPDLPHLYEVCEANDAKFPNGVAIINPETGKYLKPEGWQPPNHSKWIAMANKTHEDLEFVGTVFEAQQRILNDVKK